MGAESIIQRTASHGLHRPAGRDRASPSGRVGLGFRGGGADRQVRLDGPLEPDIAAGQLGQEPLVLEDVAVGLDQVALGADDCRAAGRRSARTRARASARRPRPGRAGASRTIRPTPGTRGGRSSGAGPDPRAPGSRSAARARGCGSGGSSQPPGDGACRPGHRARARSRRPRSPRSFRRRTRAPTAKRSSAPSSDLGIQLVPQCPVAAS